MTPTPTESQEVLLPCPFCGGPARLWGEIRSIYPHVVCDSEACKCCGPALYSAEAAAEAWNKRDPDAAYWKNQHAAALRVIDELRAANARGDGATKLLKDIRWRIEDTRETLMAYRTFGDDPNARLYGCDEWSTPTVNLKAAINRIDDFLTPHPPGSEAKS